MEEICREFAIDVVEFVFIFAEILFEVVLIHLLQAGEIIRAFGIDAFVDDKVFSVFFGNECMSTVGQRGFTEEKRLSEGKKFAAQTLQRSCYSCKEKVSRRHSGGRYRNPGCHSQNGG